MDSKEVEVALGDDVTATRVATVVIGPASTTEEFLVQCKTALGLGSARIRVFRFCFQIYHRVELPNDYDSDWVVRIYSL
jgi:hypothetical protein